MRAFIAIEKTIDGRHQFITPIQCDTLDGAVEDLVYLDRPLALYAFDTEAMIFEHVSRKAAELLSCRVVDGRITLTDTVRDFIERHSPLGSLIPAAA